MVKIVARAIVSWPVAAQVIQPTADEEENWLLAEMMSEVDLPCVHHLERTLD